MAAAVLSATDVLKRDHLMGSLDQNQINLSASTDWKMKYIEVADMLAETRAELDEFHSSSKDLEEELIRELERTETAQRDLKVKVSKAESDRDEWKSKFMSLQTTHNSTTTFLQRELDKLRQEHQATKIQLRELEMGNDDLERSERAVLSSLADVEAKYARALEEKILLEHELMEKANLEEETQRLKDELRDANNEASILKDRLAAQASSLRTRSSSQPLFKNGRPSLDEDLLRTQPPPDLQLSDLSPSSEDLLSAISAPNQQSNEQSTVPSQRIQSSPSTPNNPNSSGISRPNSTAPSSSLMRAPSMRNSFGRPSTSSARMSTSSSATAIPTVAIKSRGVQMVSEMRARVKNLEQKIHTRVPRLRMGSFTGRTSIGSAAPPTVARPGSASSASSKASTKGSFTNDRDGKMLPPRYSLDLADKKKKRSSDTSGWVLIMEDTPPAKESQQDRRRTLSPTVPTPYRSMGPPAFIPSHNIPTGNKTGSPSRSNSTKADSLAQSTTNKTDSLVQSTSGLRRPSSRLSTGNGIPRSTSITTNSGRSTPTISLPLPATGLHSSTSGSAALKQSNLPKVPNPKRSSMGSSVSGTTSSALPTFDSFTRKPLMASSVSQTITPVTSNMTTERESLKSSTSQPVSLADTGIKLPSNLSASTSGVRVLSRSRIGRPRTSSTERYSSGGDDGGLLGLKGGKKDIRLRSGSVNTGYGN